MFQTAKETQILTHQGTWHLSFTHGKTQGKDKMGHMFVDCQQFKRESLQAEFTEVLSQCNCEITKVTKLQTGESRVSGLVST